MPLQVVNFLQGMMSLISNVEVLLFIASICRKTICGTPTVPCTLSHSGGAKQKHGVHCPVALYLWLDGVDDISDSLEIMIYARGVTVENVTSVIVRQN